MCCALSRLSVLLKRSGTGFDGFDGRTVNFTLAYLVIGHFLADARDGVNLDDFLFEIVLLRVRDDSVALVGYGIDFFREYDAPFEEELQFDLCRVEAGLHDYECAFGQGFQLVGCEERSLDHLQRL